MSRPSLAELISELEAAIFAMPKTVHGLSVAARPPAAKDDQLGEYERVEESKFSSAPPPALAAEEGELPDTYGRTRLMLMVSGPYRVYAYWEVTAETLAAARRELESTGEPPRSVLRFHQISGQNGNGGWFDVEVDLAARNWYVTLWSPDKTYRAALGLRAGGGFASLAESNPIHTPRAWPKAEVEEHFLRVEPPPQSVVPPAPPPPVQQRRPRPFPPVFEELPPEFPVPPPTASRVAAPPVPIPGPAEAVEALRRRLTELLGYRDWQPEPVKIEESFAAAPMPESPFAEPPADLTALDEQQFLPGLPSSPSQGEHGGE